MKIFNILSLAVYALIPSHVMGSSDDVTLAWEQVASPSSLMVYRRGTEPFITQMVCSRDTTQISLKGEWGIKTTRAPINLCELKDLEVIDLSNNDLKEIPSSIPGLKNLRTFNIAGNGISIFDLSNQVKLTFKLHLIIGGNPISSIKLNPENKYDFEDIIHFNSKCILGIDDFHQFTDLFKSNVMGKRVVFFQNKESSFLQERYELPASGFLLCADNKDDHTRISFDRDNLDAQPSGKQREFIEQIRQSCGL